MRGCVIALLGVPAVGSLVRTHAPHPKIKKIVNLLNDMKATIDDDADADAKVNEKMECWCEKNNKTLGEAQKVSLARIEFLGGRINMNTARVAAHTTELNQVAKDITRVEGEIEEEDARMKESVEKLHAAELELTNAVSQLDNAIRVLSKHNSGLSQQKAIVSLKKHLKAHTDLLDSLMPTDRMEMMGFLQQPAGERAPTEQKGGYGSQSGEIFGILQQMLETFQGDLAGNKEEQTSNQKFHDENKARMLSEQETLASKSARLQGEKADASSQMQNDVTEIKDLKHKMGSDMEFLKIVKEKCPKHRSEYEKRVKERHMELEAIDQAVGFLTSDEAYDTFSKLPKPASFLQTHSFSRKTRSQRLHSARKYLAKNLVRVPKLGAILAQMHAGLAGFAKVKAAINTMIGELKNQRQEEVEEKDECTHEIARVNAEEKKLQNELSTLEALLESEEGKKAEADKKLAQDKIDLEQTQKDRVTLKENRKAAYKQYLTALGDQQAAVQLLEKAMEALSMQYSSLLQQEPGEGDVETKALTHTEAPELKNEYRKSAKGGTVLTILNEVVGDAKDEIATLTQDEADAKEEYDELLQVNNDSESAQRTVVAQSTNTAAELGGSIVDIEKERGLRVTALMQKQTEQQDWNMKCAFLLKNFDLRQEAITQEVDALHQVLAILGGMKVDAPLENTL